MKRRSNFRISPFTLPTDPFLAFFSTHPTPSPVNNQAETPSRRSVGSRLSSWIASQRLSKSRPDDIVDQAQLWNQDQAERGQSPVDLKVNNSLGSPYSYETAIDKPKGTPNSMSTTVIRTPEGPPLSRWTTATLTVHSRQNSSKDGSPVKESVPDSVGLQPPRTRDDYSAAYSIGSYYGGIVKESGPVFPSAGNASPVSPLAVRKADSPIYGLNGITKGVNSIRHTPASSRSTVESITELLRKQKELDNSIIGLRILSPESESSGSSSAPSSAGGAKDGDHSMLAVPEPSATRSDFSLSNFPEPPVMFDSPPNDTTSSSFAALIARIDASDEGRSRAILKADGIAGLPLPRMPILNDMPTTPQSIPDSPSRDQVLASSRMGKIDSGGTQYDVTSFIGRTLLPSLSILMVVLC